MNARNQIGRVVTLAALFASSASLAYANPAIYQHALRSTAYIVNNADKCLGSGVLVDIDNRLVVTNNHVVGTAKEVRVFFSAYNEKGELITDSRIYDKNFEVLKAARIAMVGRVVARWKDKDLALVRLSQLPDEAQALPLAAESAQPGETVHSIGSSGANDACLWRYTRGFVRNSYRCPKRKIYYLETDSATNSGDSGGPMVNDNGELVGIVVSQSVSLRLVSQAIELRELRSLLEWYSDDASDDATAESMFARQ